MDRDFAIDELMMREVIQTESGTAPGDDNKVK